MLSDIVSVFSDVVFFLVSQVLKRKIVKMYTIKMYTLGWFFKIFRNGEIEGESSHHIPPSMDMHSTTAYK